MDQRPERVKPATTENAAHVLSLPCDDSVQTWGGGVGSAARAALAFLQRYLDVILGAVLILAGALKGQQLLTDPSAGIASGFPRELLIGASAFELAFGCWLLGGMYRRLTRWLALGWFTSLAAVALAQAMGGVPSCACLGELHADPWLMFTFDLAAVAALWVWGPLGTSSARFFPLVMSLSLLPAAGILALGAAPLHQPMFAEIDLGDIAQGSRTHQAFQFRNESAASVDVGAIETSCPCASIRLERRTVAAGQILVGDLSLDLQSKPEFTGSLVIEAKGLMWRRRLVFVVVIRAHVYRVSQTMEKTL